MSEPTPLDPPAPPPWQRDPLPGEPGSADNPFPPPPLPVGYVSPGYTGAVIEGVTP